MNLPFISVFACSSLNFFQHKVTNQKIIFLPTNIILKPLKLYSEGTHVGLKRESPTSSCEKHHVPPNTGRPNKSKVSFTSFCHFGSIPSLFDLAIHLIFLVGSDLLWLSLSSLQRDRCIYFFDDGSNQVLLLCFMCQHHHFIFGGVSEAAINRNLINTISVKMQTFTKTSIT